MKLLLPEAASNAGAPADAVQRGRGRDQAAHQNVIRILKVNRSTDHAVLHHGVLPVRAACGLRLQAKDIGVHQGARPEDLQAGGDRAWRT